MPAQSILAPLRLSVRELVAILVSPDGKTATPAALLDEVGLPPHAGWSLVGIPLSRDCGRATMIRSADGNRYAVVQPARTGKYAPMAAYLRLDSDEWTAAKITEMVPRMLDGDDRCRRSLMELVLQLYHSPHHSPLGWPM